MESGEQNEIKLMKTNGESNGKEVGEPGEPGIEIRRKFKNMDFNI